MRLLLTRWGFLRYEPMLDFYVDWKVVQRMINTEQYLISRWLFLNLPKIFKNSYMLYLSDGITTKQHVISLIKKFEEVEDITLSDEKKQEIMDKSQEFLEDTKKPMLIQITVD